MKFNTKVIHGGQQRSTTGAVMPPVFQTSTFAQSSPGKPIGDYGYSRSANPTEQPRGSLGKYRKWCGLAFHRDLLLLIA
jgi:cystathionine beta-lyase/cystathionine gamma-synthase